MKKGFLYIFALVAVLGLCNCASRKKNTAATRAYHAFTARYNTYYNGKQAYDQALKAQSKGHKDNYLELLPLLTISDENTDRKSVV